MKIKINEIKISERVRKKLENVTDLSESIKELGLLQPILINKEKILIAGHRRIVAHNVLGLKEIECNIINPTNELQKLDMELSENIKREDFNPMELAKGLARRKELYEILHPETKVGVTGKGRPKDSLSDSDNLKERFTLDTAKKYKISETKIKETIQLNDIKPELQKDVEDNKKTKSQALAIHRKEKKIEKIKKDIQDVSTEELGLFQGDCLTQLDKIKNNSIACLIIDAPYGIDYQSNHKLAKHEKIANDKSDAFELLDKSLEKVRSKMLDNSHAYIFTSWKVIDNVKPIVARHFKIKNVLIWNKNNWSMGDLKGNYAEKYEMIIFATKGDRDLLGDKRPVNVLDFARTGNSNHPTEKPVNLLKELIKNSTVEGETVLDYFAGSGSTLVASKELKRNWIGIEINEEYVNIIKNRLKIVTL